LRENWDLRDHSYVLGKVDKAQTRAHLRLATALMNDYSICYKAWIAENARIIAAAKAGQWTPGACITALGKSLENRGKCTEAAKKKFEEAMI